MPYRTMGWIHATVIRLWSEQRGQGTVEYVGLMLLIATVLTAVVTASKNVGGPDIAAAIVDQMKKAIGQVTSNKTP
jgi:Flp pilus assembly pilin Flp